MTAFPLLLEPAPLRAALAHSPSSLESARRSLKEKGWSYRRAAKPLGVHYSHLCLVLTGKRNSRSLLQRIHALRAQ